MSASLENKDAVPTVRTSVGRRLRLAFFALTSITIATVVVAFSITWYAYQRETVLAFAIAQSVDVLNRGADRFRELSEASQPPDVSLAANDLDTQKTKFDADSKAFAENLREIASLETIEQETTKQFISGLEELRKGHSQALDLSVQANRLASGMASTIEQLSAEIDNTITQAEQYEVTLNLSLLNRLPVQAGTDDQWLPKQLGSLRRLTELRTLFSILQDTITGLAHDATSGEIAPVRTKIQHDLSNATILALSLPQGRQRADFARTIARLKDALLADDGLVQNKSDFIELKGEIDGYAVVISQLNGDISRRLSDIFERNKANAAEAQQRTTRFILATVGLLIVLAVLAVLISAFAVWKLVLGDIVGRMDLLWSRASAIARGNLRTAVEIDGTDEIAALAREIDASRLKTIRLIEADQEIRASAGRLSLAAETGRLGIFDWPDLSENNALYSAELAQMLGLGEEAIEDVPERLINQIEPEQRADIETWFDVQAARSLGSHDRAMICRLNTPLGWRWHEIAARLLDEFSEDRGRLARRAILAIRDVDETILIQRDLQKQTDDLARANEELDRFAYVASHDLKSPMRAIADLSGWLEEDLDEVLDDDSRDSLRLLKKRAERLITLLDDLLAFSRVGRTPGRSTTVNIAEIARDAFELACGTRPFELVLAGDMRPIETDPTPLHQVLLNLFSNAIKHHDRERGCITLSHEHENGLEWFSVSDDGPGIEERFQERIFEMFTTLRPRDEVEGSGIGLAVIKKQVGLFGGRIEVFSSPGTKRGSTFRFSWKSGETPDGEPSLPRQRQEAET